MVQNVKRRGTGYSGPDSTRPSQSQESDRANEGGTAPGGTVAFMGAASKRCTAGTTPDKTSAQRWRERHPVEWKEQGKQGFINWVTRHPLRNKFLQARRSRKAKELGFTITEADLLISGELPRLCPYLGIKLDYSYRGGAGGRHDDAPSIDRIDSSQGYHPGNVVVCSWLANKIKGHGSLNQLEQIVREMRRLL